MVYFYDGTWKAFITIDFSSTHLTYGRNVMAKSFAKRKSIDIFIYVYK